MARANKFLSYFSCMFFFCSHNASAISASELKEKLLSDEQFLLIDIRPSTHYRIAHIQRSINIPSALLVKKRVPFRGDVVIYGDGVSADVSKKVFDYLLGVSGLSVHLLDGGYPAWSALNSGIFNQKGISAGGEIGINYQRLVELSARDTRPLLIDLRLSATKENISDHFPLNETLSLGNLNQDYLGDVVARIPKNNKKLLVLIADDSSLSIKVANRLNAAGVKLLAVLVGGEHALKSRGVASTSLAIPDIGE